MSVGVLAPSSLPFIIRAVIIDHFGLVQSDAAATIYITENMPNLVQDDAVLFREFMCAPRHNVGAEPRRDRMLP